MQKIIQNNCSRLTLNSGIILLCLLISFLFGANNLKAQNNLLVLNGADVVLNGGTLSIPVYLIVNQNNTQGISRISGHIISENQYNYVKWNCNTTTGNYVIPFGYSTTDYLPLTFNKTTSTSANINFSTWATNAQNMPHANISDNGIVAACNNMTGAAGDSVASVIDRWWDIYSPTAVTANITFSYRGAENVTTTNQTDTIDAQHWNGSSWDTPVLGSMTGVTSGIGTASFSGLNSFSPWVLVHHPSSQAIYTANFNYSSACVGVPVNFTNTSTPSASITNYYWDFDNNGTWDDFTANPTHVFSTVGTQQVKYVTAWSSITDTIIQLINVTAPQATNISSVGPFCAGAPNVSLSINPSGTSGTWSGAGIINTSSGLFSPFTSGTNAITFTPTTGTCFSASSVNIVVNPSPNDPVGVLSANSICVGESSTINVSPAQSNVTYAVSNASGFIGNAPTIVSPINTTSYSIVATSSVGCQNSGGAQSLNLVVNTKPVVSILSDAGLSDIYQGQLITFTSLPSTYSNYNFYVDNASVQNSSSNSYSSSSLNDGQVVSVTANEGSCISDTVKIKVIIKPLPNAFSPNGDGVNDLFLKGLDLQIINRWGQELFSGTSGWDGKYNGQIVSPGSYFYIITFKDANGTETKLNGPLLLIGNN